ncbi:DNA topoisomerase IB [Sphingobacterium yanglingense]|uniref:DNA topoisomerase n=1 Tax=Sphingobacterium yanglingense TaxID=1437280 RepID=A0A4R6WMI9_9SPHI|nr:DNA topoisomerase IB [Sphingobacterium yanglingense]TDQ80002.1 DNA topoisomerase-1 [Sphingobacterium yanglingense]
MPIADNLISDSEALHEAGLRYVSCKERGYQRVRRGKKIKYIDQEGKPIQNPQTLARIQALVIPPAWKNVWICPLSNGHLQATGKDERGRKQYRYHQLWTEIRKQQKFSNLYIFGKKQAQLERQIIKDLELTKFCKEKVCALALAVMSRTYFRVGNTIYEKENKSYGLTTLRNHHLKQLSTHKVFFKFIGKKGIQQQHFLKEKSLIRLLNKVKEIPGQRLFQYYNHMDRITPLDSGNLNDYIQEATKTDLTCKTLRTWYACILTLYYMGQSIPLKNQTERTTQLLRVIDSVAHQLGNTRAVTRTHYIHPSIQEIYLSGDLNQWIKRVNKQEHLKPADNLYKRKLMQLLRYTIQQP